MAKFGVVALTETLQMELRGEGDAIGASVLCPGAIATRIAESERNRPDAAAETETNQRFHAGAGKVVAAGIRLRAWPSSSSTRSGPASSGSSPTPTGSTSCASASTAWRTGADSSRASVAEGDVRRVALVTGAAQGLGRALAEALAAEGDAVAACDRDPAVEALDATTFVADVSRPEDVRRVVDGTVAAHGRIDVLVNNAGIARPSRAGQDWDTGLRDYEDVIGTNLRGAFLFGRAVAPVMIAQGSGHIVNVSTDHVYPEPGHKVWGHGGMDLYNASKWALNGLTLDWATTLARKGVRVNGLCLGATDTPMLRAFAGDVGDEVVATWMQPADVCALLLELLAEGPEGRTGHNLGAWVGRPLRLDDSIEVGHRR